MIWKPKFLLKRTDVALRFTGDTQMAKIFNLTLAAGFLTAATLMTPVAFAETTYPGGDQAETNAVQAAIDKDLALRIDQIQVQTIGGVVYLHGIVGSEATAERAEAIAQSVAHGGKVVDALGENSES
jgi:osmotically-inducible protein OsmY